MVSLPDFQDRAGKLLTARIEDLAGNSKRHAGITGDAQAGGFGGEPFVKGTEVVGRRGFALFTLFEGMKHCGGSVRGSDHERAEGERFLQNFATGKWRGHRRLLQSAIR